MNIEALSDGLFEWRQSYAHLPRELLWNKHAIGHIKNTGHCPAAPDGYWSAVLCGAEFGPYPTRERAERQLIGQAIEWLEMRNAGPVKKLLAEVERLRHLINSPEVKSFTDGVMIEAAHQQERWGASHDAGKAPLDWFWLIGFLSQKAATAAMAGDLDKARHHTISTAAALAHWHRYLSGEVSDGLRPGIDPATRGLEALS